MKRTLTAVLIVGVCILALGCGPESSNNSLSDISTAWNIEFNLASPSANIVGGDTPNTQQGYAAEGPDSITIDYGAVVIRSLRFVDGEAGAVDTQITAEEESRDESDPDISHKGPYVLPVNAALQPLGSGAVVRGAYTEVRFVLQPARASDELNGLDDLLGNSILVRGRIWSAGESRRFTFSSDYTSEYSVRGVYDLSAGDDVQYTLRFNVGRWFRAGNAWLNPGNSGHRVRIMDNIRLNIQVVRDV